jgi:hypothetical protein
LSIVQTRLISIKYKYKYQQYRIPDRLNIT